MDEPSVAITVGAAVVVAIVLLVLGRRGVMGAAAFERAPLREGTLALYDLAVVVGLLMVGQYVAITVATALGLLPEEPRGRMLYAMAAGYAGSLPALVYLFYRAATAVRGGVLAFGLGAGRDAVKVTLLGVLAIFPLTLGTAALTVQVSLWVGEPAPAIAHETLRVLREDPTGPTAIGLMLMAVVVAPVLEEVLFRGFLQTSLLHAGVVRSRWVAIIGASVLFVLIHVPALMVPAETADGANVPLASGVPAGLVESAESDAADADGLAAAVGGAAQVTAEEAEPSRQFAWHGLPGLLVLSLGLGYLYERTGSLWPPIFVHGLFNLSQIFLALNVVE